MLTSSWIIRLRGITRRLGLNKWIGSLLSDRRYEDRFGRAVQAEVRPGDTVWDIGANLGLYTQAFVAAVGREGCVVAFEPVPACFARLHERFGEVRSVRLMNVAVGDADGRIGMVLNADPLAATHRVVASTAASTRGAVEVEVRSAGSIVGQEPAFFPNLVKIDVEGHEGAVMDGMRGLLADRRLRCIGMEVHFALLDERGESARPKQFVETLVQHGFHVRWTDPSHLLAVR